MVRLSLKDEYSPREHHAWASSAWRRIDRDNSGYITRSELDCEEFRALLRRVITPDTRGYCMGGPRYARAQINTDQAVAFFMRKADINGDGQISFKEFKAFTGGLRTHHGPLHTAGMVFALFDSDTDGKIDEMEFREICRFFLGREPTEREFQDEWSNLDSAGAGQVSRERYVEWLHSSANPVFSIHKPPAAEPGGGSAPAGASSGGAAMGATWTGQSDAWDNSPDDTRSSGWRPWETYSHFCWHDPTRGKPSHARMKFRDTSPCTTWSPCGSSSSKRRAAREDPRPDWNPYLASMSPNWPDKNGKSRQILGRRQYFLRPQSLPELSRYLSSKPGHRDLHEAMLSKDPKIPRTVFSHEHTGGASQILSIGSRGRTGGSMRHPYTRERRRWDDHWGTAFQTKDFFHPAPKTSIGPPPRHLFMDVYEDECRGIVNT
mmetsp:Transcript_44334/g.128953  ORF Transcript_44334/g.128953 Transcript_44334/m.128953 type:complete len:434 (-) Transcript_44334:78-1379(-)